MIAILTVLASSLITTGTVQSSTVQFESSCVPSSINNLLISIPHTVLNNADETDFKHKVYEAQMKYASKRRKLLANLPEKQLEVIEDGYKMRKDAAEKCRLLLAQARADLKRQKERKNSQALKVSNIGIASAYRSVEHDGIAWEKAFEKHLKATKLIRAKLKGGEYGTEAVEFLAARMRKFKAVPGYSRHTSGVAVDFTTTENNVVLSTDSNQAEEWKRSWFHKWLVNNADRYKFKPLSTEAWHWEYDDRIRPTLLTLTP